VLGRAIGPARFVEIPSRDTRRADPRTTTAKIAKTWPGPVRERTRPATNGPITIPAFSENVENAFAAVSSSGPSDTFGRRAACVGRVNMKLVAATVATARVSPSDAPANNAAATSPSVIDCPRYPANRTRSLRNRSPAYAAKGASTIVGSSWTTATTPAVDAPPSWYAYTRIATQVAYSVMLKPRNASWIRNIRRSRTTAPATASCSRIRRRMAPAARRRSRTRTAPRRPTYVRISTFVQTFESPAGFGGESLPSVHAGSTTSEETAIWL
jgi:hypothetical protein